MADADLAFADVAAQAELVRPGQVCARDLAELALARIERLDGRLNAFAAVHRERALEDGQPAASVPAGFSSDGLPLAVQLVGRPYDEVTLISLAAQVEAARPWAYHRPPVGTA